MAPLTPRSQATAGVGPGISFASKLLEAGWEGRIGLIPVAVGGTAMARWMPGADLYEAAVSTLKEAMSAAPRPAQIVGILWHQGESDCSCADDATTLGERLTEMATHLRNEPFMPEHTVPFVLGQLGAFIEGRTDFSERFSQIAYARASLQTVPAQLAESGIVSVEGLGHIGDNLHFDAMGARAMGALYADAFTTLHTKHSSFKLPRLGEVTMKEVTLQNVGYPGIAGVCLGKGVLGLELAPGQDHFVTDNATSIAQAHFHGEKKAWFRAVYAGVCGVNHPSCLFGVLSVWRRVWGLTVMMMMMWR